MRRPTGDTVIVSKGNPTSARGHHPDAERCGSAVAEEIPSTFANPRGLSTVEREARPAELRFTLPGLTENDKVMSDQYEACPKDDLHNTLCEHR